LIIFVVTVVIANLRNIARQPKVDEQDSVVTAVYPVPEAGRWTE
jgi:hypothetical protein